RRWDIPALEFDEEQLKTHKELLAQRKPFQNFVYRRIMADGSRIFVSVTGSPIFDAAGNFQGYRGIGRNVSAQKRAEQQISESHQYLADLLNAMPSLVAVKDENHRFIAANDALCRFQGRPREDIV